MNVLLPTEIYQKIFEYACTDDGATGRSLALVSRCFQALSKRFKLQSIALVGARQLRGFATYLTGLAPNARCVHHLCVSLVFDTGLPKTSQCRYMVEEGTFDFWEHEKDASASLLRILLCLAPSLTTLHLISNLRRTSILLPIPLPFLRNLTIHGPMRVGNRTRSSHPIFSSLRDLSLISFQDYPTTTLQQITRQAPFLQSLSFSLDRPLPDLSRDFLRALQDKPYDPAHGVLPPSLTRICVWHIIGSVIDTNMWLRIAQKEMLEGLSKLSEIDRRVAVVGMYRLLDYPEARLRWLEGASWHN